MYLDDIVVSGNALVEHIKRLHNVFLALRNAGLQLKPSKCQRKVHYLGHAVSAACRYSTRSSQDNSCHVISFTH